MLRSNYKIKSKLTRIAILAAGIASTSCKDIPFAPRWDADFYLPLSTRSIYLDNYFQFGLIPSGISANISFSPETQDLSGVVREAIKNIETDSAKARTVLTLSVSKRTPIITSDTIIIAKDSSSLTNSSLENIVFPISLNSKDTLMTDSMQLSLPSIKMLQNAGYSGLPLWVQMRGYVNNPNSYSVPISSSDSITAKLSVTARISVSKE